MHSTIIDEHFVALHITTPLKTIDQLKDISEKIEEYRLLNNDDLDKYVRWNEEHKVLLENIQELNEKLYSQKNTKINLWDFGKFKPESIIVWPIRFIGASFITMLFLPIMLYKKGYSTSDLEKSIKQSRDKFDSAHPNYLNFMDEINNKNEKFLDSIKKELNICLNKSVGIIDFKGNEYKYSKYVEDVNSLYKLIDEQLILYYEMVDKVLNIHIHDVMNEITIKEYILDFINDENLHALFEHVHEIDELRNKLENRYNDKSKSIEEKDWKTTIDIIKTKLKKQQD